jgi:hypothetical protein
MLEKGSCKVIKISTFFFYFKIIILTPGWTHGENYEVLVGKIGLEVPRKSRIVKKEGKGGLHSRIFVPFRLSYQSQYF